MTYSELCTDVNHIWEDGHRSIKSNLILTSNVVSRRINASNVLSTRVFKSCERIYTDIGRYREWSQTASVMDLNAAARILCSICFLSNRPTVL